MRLAYPGDETAINALLNDPSIRPHIFAGNFPIDVTGMIGAMIFVFDEDGLFAAEAIGDGEYLVMSAFKPGGRGLKSVVSHRRALDVIFSEMDAFRVYATIDKSNLPSVRAVFGLQFSLSRNTSRVVAEMDWTKWASTSRNNRKDGSLLASILFKDESVPDWMINALGGFVRTVRGGWPGKALKCWHKIMTLNHLHEIRPTHEVEDIYSYGNGIQFKITQDGVVEV